ncbi:flavin-containing monooxygenase [Persicitalea sp.]|uniref:flavin-containing monooxygenase n=1 Tax=Persicitalea sp. TaxID=3100273 RepID=UPI003594910C
MKNLIIGAGPSGLAIAGRLAKAGQDFTVIEKGLHIGEAWHHHYDRLHLHTDRRFSGLPHRPIPKNYPVFVPRLDLIKYWENYANHFNIKPLFGQALQKLRREGTFWVAKTATDTFRAENVMLCTGYNRVPNVPRWPGQEKYQGTILHSSEYKNADLFRGKNVLVVGMGNSGAEIALDLSQQAASTFLSVRSPTNIMKRDIAGKPTQLAAIVMSALLPNRAYDAISRFIQQRTVGDLSAYGLQTPEYSPSEGVRMGRIPVLDVGTIEQIKAEKIKVTTGISHFSATSVELSDGQVLGVDAVVLATGYRAWLGELVPELEPLLNRRGGVDKLWYDAFPGLYFLGFSEPLTGILRGINLDSKKIVKHLTAGGV